MRYMRVILILPVLLACMVSAHAANSNVESVLKRSADLSEFYRLLTETGVLKELQEDTEYTVFAPTNTAFAEIQPRTYPCFDAAECRPQLAAILRNHILPRKESIRDLSKWGDISTIGDREILILESYAGQYTVEDHMVLNQDDNTDVSLFRIDGIIATDREMDTFRTMPSAGPAASQ